MDAGGSGPADRGIAQSPVSSPALTEYEVASGAPRSSASNYQTGNYQTGMSTPPVAQAERPVGPPAAISKEIAKDVFLVKEYVDKASEYDFHQLIFRVTNDSLNDIELTTDLRGSENIVVSTSQASAQAARADQASRPYGGKKLKVNFLAALQHQPQANFTTTLQDELVVATQAQMKTLRVLVCIVTLKSNWKLRTKFKLKVNQSSVES